MQPEGVLLPALGLKPTGAVDHPVPAPTSSQTPKSPSRSSVLLQTGRHVPATTSTITSEVATTSSGGNHVQHTQAGQSGSANDCHARPGDSNTSRSAAVHCLPGLISQRSGGLLPDLPAAMPTFPPSQPSGKATVHQHSAEARARTYSADGRALAGSSYSRCSGLAEGRRAIECPPGPCSHTAAAASSPTHGLSSAPDSPSPSRARCTVDGSGHMKAAGLNLSRLAGQAQGGLCQPSDEPAGPASPDRRSCSSSRSSSNGNCSGRPRPSDEAAARLLPKLSSSGFGKGARIKFNAQAVHTFLGLEPGSPQMLHAKPLQPSAAVAAAGGSQPGESGGPKDPDSDADDSSECSTPRAGPGSPLPAAMVQLQCESNPSAAPSSLVPSDAGSAATATAMPAALLTGPRHAHRFTHRTLSDHGARASVSSAPCSPKRAAPHALSSDTTSAGYENTHANTICAGFVGAGLSPHGRLMQHMPAMPTGVLLPGASSAVGSPVRGASLAGDDSTGAIGSPKESLQAAAKLLSKLPRVDIERVKNDPAYRHNLRRAGDAPEALRAKLESGDPRHDKWRGNSMQPLQPRASTGGMVEVPPLVTSGVTTLPQPLDRMGIKALAHMANAGQHAATVGGACGLSLAEAACKAGAANKEEVPALAAPALVQGWASEYNRERAKAHKIIGAVQGVPLTLKDIKTITGTAGTVPPDA